ncbi:MAG TPA: LemA family protein [Bacilli bacterium]|nr:LemA family protein [Bacilli bacterium]
MANQLDETNFQVNEEGRDIHVINKQLAIKVGTGSLIFEILLWVFGIIPGVIFLFMKISARNYFDRLQQKIQSDASTIDNYLEQRVMILQNVVGLVERAVDLDKDTFTKIAAYRSGRNVDNETQRNEVSNQVDNIYGQISVAVENYPDLKAHASIADAMQQNSYLQKEITAARQLYNDSVERWNQDVQMWPTKKIVAARAGFTTRIPFTASRAVKEQARAKFF